uniref:Uncharacterized protein n=1 Tax=Anthurium amnicola TaxID=1678845 RepID=A0A1D1Z5P6_9ARAE
MMGVAGALCPRSYLFISAMCWSQNKVEIFRSVCKVPPIISTTAEFCFLYVNGYGLHCGKQGLLSSFAVPSTNLFSVWAWFTYLVLQGKLTQIFSYSCKAVIAMYSFP